MMQTRHVLGVAAAAVTVTGLLLPMQSASAETACSFTDNTNTQIRSLNGDCDLGATLPVADGWTIDGNSHTITVSGTGFNGPIIQSASGSSGGQPATMNVKHLTIAAVGFGSATGHLVGILYDGAQGSVSDVRISGVSHGSVGDNGYGVEAANSAGVVFGATDQVKVDNQTTISGYQRAAIYAHGDLKLTVLRAVLNAPDAIGGQAVAGVLATDGVHGSVKETEIALSDTEPSSPTAFGAGVQLSETRRVEVRRNVFSGTAADFGVSVANPAQAARTTAVVDCNLFDRNDSSATDTYGVAAGRWDDGSKTNLQLTNSTFVGDWAYTSGVVSGTNVTAGPADVQDGLCPPPAPTNVAAPGGDRRTTVTWSASSPVYSPLTGFRVSAKAAGHPAVTTTVGPGATSTELTGLNNKLTYNISVTAQDNGGEATGTTRLYSTSLTLSPGSQTIHRGNGTTLRGQLSSKDPNGQFSGLKVQIWAKPHGGSWSKLDTVKTKGGGHFSRSVKPRRTTTYKAVYAGNPGLASKHLTTVKVIR
jgi:hypothetical protein